MFFENIGKLVNTCIDFILFNEKKSDKTKQFTLTINKQTNDKTKKLGFRLNQSIRTIYMATIE